MVFGALLGGMAMRAGERFHENADRQHELEKWQRSKQLEFLSDQAAKDWDNWDADQQIAHGNAIGKLVGASHKDVQSWVTASKAIHGMIPQIQAVPESLGPAQRGGTVTATPSAEPGVGAIAAGNYSPTVPQFSQLPAPGETLSPSIMAPTTGGTAQYGRDMTPNQMRAQQKADMDAQLRKQQETEIDQIPGIPENMRTAAKMHLRGVNTMGLEAAEVNAAQRRNAADQHYLLSMQKMSSFYGKPTSVRRGTDDILVWGTPEGAKTMGPEGVPVPYVPAHGDKMQDEKTGGLQIYSDDNHAWVVDKAGVVSGKAGSVTQVPGVGVKTPAPTVVERITPEGQTQKVLIPRTKAGKGLTISPPPATAERKTLDQSANIERQMDDLEKLYKPEYLGAWRGSSIGRSIREHVPGAAPYLGLPENMSQEESQFQAQLNQVRDLVLNQLSGAAVSAHEMARIKGELPDATLSDSAFKARVAATRRNVKYLGDLIKQRSNITTTPLAPVGTGGAETPEARKQRLMQKYGTK